MGTSCKKIHIRKKIHNKIHIRKKIRKKIHIRKKIRKKIHIRKKIRKKIHKKIQDDTFNDPVSTPYGKANYSLRLDSFLKSLVILKFLPSLRSCKNLSG